MHRTADGYEIHEGDTFWDNNLDLVTITKVDSYQETNQNQSHPDFGQVTHWHDTTKGMTDGSRLAKYHPFTRKEAKPAARRAIYRNVNGFSSAVPETRHDDHPVTVGAQLGSDKADPEVGPMFTVTCETDGATFDAFEEELREH